MEIEKTADGSCTIFLPEMNEHYHSIKGAITESNHIFIDKALRFHTKKDVNVLEIGFGTGLNAILTLLEAENNKRKVHYTTIEKYPLEMDIIKSLNYISLVGEENISMFYNLHQCTWNEENNISHFFTINKINDDFTDFRFNEQFDVVYFDAFAPEKQPEMWTQQLFDYIFSIMNKGGILTTYCAKGIVRRMLKTSGFKVERLPGPPNGKREILRAVKID